jgi:hypothetical protein
MFFVVVTIKVNRYYIICFKIKNPQTLHSTSKIQPTTSQTFVFSVCKCQKKAGL